MYLRNVAEYLHQFSIQMKCLKSIEENVFETLHYKLPVCYRTSKLYNYRNIQLVYLNPNTIGTPHLIANNFNQRFGVSSDNIILSRTFGLRRHNLRRECLGHLRLMTYDL